MPDWQQGAGHHYKYQTLHVKLFFLTRLGDCCLPLETQLDPIKLRFATAPPSSLQHLVWRVRCSEGDHCIAYKKQLFIPSIQFKSELLVDAACMEPLRKKKKKRSRSRSRSRHLHVTQQPMPADLPSHQAKGGIKVRKSLHKLRQVKKTHVRRRYCETRKGIHSTTVKVCER